MSRASTGSFADFFPNAPSVLQRKRKKASGEEGRDSPVSSASPSTALAAPSHNASSSDSRSEQKHNTFTSSRDEDDAHRGDSEELLNGVGSASSLHSTVSSVFSNNQSTDSSYPGPTSSLYTLTPLTISNSSPGKALSPSSNKALNEHASSASAIPHNAPLMSSTLPQDISGTMTPVHTPPETRRQARPGPGEVKGLMIRFDPMLDNKLSKDEKKERDRQVRYKSFGEQVRLR